MKKSFTLLEMLIVIALIVSLATTAIYLIDPVKQIQKDWDSKRKNEMASISKALEDFYNDKQCYPLPSEICYDSATALGDNSYICHICGSKNTPSAIAKYANQLLCDPQNPSKNYLYHAKDNSCPQSYEIYTTLSNAQDTAINDVGCSAGCGAGSTNSDYSYNYCVCSSNTKCGIYELPLCSDYSTLFMQSSAHACDVCGGNAQINPACKYTGRDDTVGKCINPCRK